MTTPFHKIVAMFGTEPVVVSHKILDEVRSYMPKNSVPKYSDIMSVLEYLDSKNALQLTKVGEATFINNPHYGKN